MIKSKLSDCRGRDGDKDNDNRVEVAAASRTPNSLGHFALLKCDSGGPPCIYTCLFKWLESFGSPTKHPLI